MGILGADGQEAKSEPKGDESPVIQYAVGGVEVGSPETPEQVLGRAVLGAKQMVYAQSEAQAMQQLGDRSMAQKMASAAANSCNNPFTLEPAAQAVFMLMAREIEWRDQVIQSLCARLDKIDGESSSDLLQKSWLVEAAKNADEN